MKSFIYSKTFWAAVASAGIEILTAYQAMPFLSEKMSHVISLALVIFIALNRAVKNYSTKRSK